MDRQARVKLPYMHTWARKTPGAVPRVLHRSVHLLTRFRGLEEQEATAAQETADKEAKDDGT
jgi:hypothetical protein